MQSAPGEITTPFDSVKKAFSSQSHSFDQDDRENPVLQMMRRQVYAHVDLFIKPQSSILELNAGTGIDALRFVHAGHAVHATDLSEGMIRQIREKIKVHELEGRLSCEELPYDQLNKLQRRGFNYVFSNFGGLNCIADLRQVTKHLPELITDGAYVTWVIMPPVSLWELASAVKGNFTYAFRRFNRHGVVAHLEGHYFKTYYHSLNSIRSAFGKQFTLVCAESLGCVSPPPHAAHLMIRQPKLFSILQRIDQLMRRIFPFNRTGDHIIVTFQYKWSQ